MRRKRWGSHLNCQIGRFTLVWPPTRPVRGRDVARVEMRLGDLRGLIVSCVAEYRANSPSRSRRIAWHLLQRLWACPMPVGRVRGPLWAGEGGVVSACDGLVGAMLLF